ncbi:FadR/GntR family transcriptional regulator [Microbacterium sediminis]|uniref:GntR family transcriptional regulator n=1 Tax=Microbacterium sediminis TaxID=904291 RepID=A0A1B9NDC8_9MICO|nr:FCD domain-containing protein [Microbacterium sediminis]OCG74602.1 GntR family transcriptional regulator [Microbacterium sediminis]QBR74895.1 FadR family transcriptional regulator [Microbacterium sediminis]
MDDRRQPGLDTGVQRTVFRPVRAGQKLEDTVARLVQAIRLGVVPPGQALPPERELAKQLRVSRDLLREAIRELSAAGVLESRRGRYGGTFVRDHAPQSTGLAAVDATQLDHVLGLRRVLEGGAAREAAARSLPPDQAERLQLAHRAVRGSRNDYRRLDTLLHLQIAQASGMPALAGAVAENRAQVNAWLDTFPLLPGNIDHSDAQHERIIGAIMAGRPDAAQDAMLEHLSGTEALLRGFLS